MMAHTPTALRAVYWRAAWSALWLAAAIGTMLLRG